MLFTYAVLSFLSRLFLDWLRISIRDHVCTFPLPTVQCPPLGPTYAKTNYSICPSNRQFSSFSSLLHISFIPLCSFPPPSFFISSSSSFISLFLPLFSSFIASSSSYNQGSCLIASRTTLSVYPQQSLSVFSSILSDYSHFRGFKSFGPKSNEFWNFFWLRFSLC